MSLPNSRLRTANDLGPGELRYRWQGDGYASLRAVGSWPSFRRIESIEDVVGTPKTLRVKPVIHSSYRYTGLPYQAFPADYGLWVIPDETALPEIVSSDFESDVFFPSSASIVQANGEAFTFFAERFPTKISGAEFVQGLFELSSLMYKLESTVQKTIASNYLTAKFGWDNLISDLQKFTTLASSIRERMEFLKRTYGRPTKLHFHKPNFHEVDPNWELERMPIRSFGTRLKLRSYRCDYHASASLTQQLSHIDDFIGWLRAIVISLGLNNIASSIWKTTRLSFVVDWVFNVSGHLARLAAIQPAERWDVSDISHSVSMQAKFDVFQENKYRFESTSDNIVYLGTLVVKRYVRGVGLPLDLTIFTPSSLTPDQLVLALAMGASK